MTGYVSRPRDIIGGIATVAVGIGFLMIGTDLEFGTARQMGPGYFPVVLSYSPDHPGPCACHLGVAATARRGQRRIHSMANPRPNHPADDLFRSNASGPWPSSSPSSLLSLPWRSPAGTLQSSLRSQARAIITAFCSLIFIAGLGLPLPVVGSWINPSNWSGAEVPAEAPAEPSN